MALSGSKNFTMARDEIIDSAIRQLGISRSYKTGVTPAKNQAAEALNALVKAWQAEGIGLWMLTEVALFLQDDKQYYDIGPSGDYASPSWVKTELSSDAATSDLVILVDSTTGIGVSDIVGVELDDGTIQWTEADTAPSDSDITVKAKLNGGASENNHVYSYEEIVSRPLEITEMRFVQEDGSEYTMQEYSRSQYMSIPTKDTTGKATIYYTDYQLTNLRVFVWPVCEDVKEYIKFTARIPVDDFDSVTDNAQFPTEWLRALKYNLAYELCLEYDVPADKMAMIRAMAVESKQALMYQDKEHSSTYFEVDNITWR